MKRREFLRKGGRVMAGGMLLGGARSGHAQGAGIGPDGGRVGPSAEGTRPEHAWPGGPVVIDALGEIRLEYPMELIDEIRDSGLTTCVITVGNPVMQGADALPDLAAEVADYNTHIQRHPDRLSTVTSTADIQRAHGDGTLGLLYYTQNATPLADDLTRVEALHAMGVRIVQLTYNHRNLLGDGYLERTNSGLSTFGIQAVERMNEVGILVDVSHCGEATSLDAIRFSSQPVAITHAGCAAVFENPRNKSDAVLRAMAEKGGVVGILQLNPYLGPRERNDLDDYLDHIDHAVDVCGIDHVGIGSDREHQHIVDTPEEVERLRVEIARLGPEAAARFRWPFFLSELNHPRRMETVAQALSRRGRPAREIEKLLGGNFLRLFGETIG